MSKPPIEPDTQSARTSERLVVQIWRYLWENKKWWLLPIVGALLLMGLLICLSGTAAAPFIYTLF